MSPPLSSPPPRDSAPGGIPAGYGRSCTNCSRAKCRCILRLEGGRCDRCHRLDKPCQQMVTSRRRVSKKPSASSRTAQLEEKLYDLIAILKTTQQSQPQSPAASAATSSSISTTAATDASPRESSHKEPAVRDAHTPAQPALPFVSRLDSLADAASSSHPRPSPGGSVTRSLPSVVSDGAEPTPAEAETYLDRFRGWLRNWPFMRLDADVTPDQLRRETPLLWLSIMNLASVSPPQQILLKDRVHHEIVQHIFVDGERSMDMILALLAQIGWAMFNTGNGGKPYLVMFIQLAAGIAYEMGLAKNPDDENFSAFCLKMWNGRLHYQSKMRTLEERRAVLSLWFMSSVKSSFMDKMEALVFSPHMRDSLEVLDSTKDYPDDAILVALVRLQLIGEEARKLLLQDRLTHHSSDADRVPTHLFKQGLLSQLQALRQALDPALISNCAITSLSLGIEVQIHSLGLFSIPKLPDNPRISAMCATVMVIKSWYAAFFDTPVHSIVSMPLYVYVCLAQMQNLLYSLTTLHDPLWDRDWLRNTANLLRYLDRCVDSFSRADAQRRGDGPAGVFSRYAKLFAALRSHWEPALAPYLRGPPTPASEADPPQPYCDQSQQHQQQQQQQQQQSDPVVFRDMNDMTWISDVFGPWDF